MKPSRVYLLNCPGWYVAARWAGHVMAQQEGTGDCVILTAAEFDEIACRGEEVRAIWDLMTIQ